MDISEQTKAKMLAALEHLKNELKSIRTGRANPGMVEGVSVEIYGSPMRLKDIASISSPEARMLLITPFDPKNSAVIGKAIEKANLGVSPIVEANLVRIKIPPMDDAMRKEMVKLCHKRLEEAKVTIRNIRRDGNNDARKHKDLAEDIVKKIEKTIQDLTDKCCKEADDLAQKKEKEISTI